MADDYQTHLVNNYTGNLKLSFLENLLTQNVEILFYLSCIYSTL